ncbi:MAG: type IV pilus twitching motility protein PilT [Deltaproteobacteria bacterium]|nr:type IV pilus twitching motility protein PilT [Candidatus Anaeroferrophillacea bacterium]
MAKIDALLKIMLDYNASDLHITSGAPPILRISGELERVVYHELTQEEVKLLAYEILTPASIKTFEDQLDVDFAYEIPGIARFRGNAYYKHRGMGAAFRLIPREIKTFSELGLPPAVRELARKRKGLVIVTGPTGSGKSTTLAAMVDLLNKERKAHIITLEDPLEFIHENQTCLIMQRQVGVHVESFASGLKASLREDPNVIMVGEMRDLETIALAITAAETGLLVFGTLHTSSAAKTVDRIIDIFPRDQQDQIRTMLSESLKGVVAQQLLRTADGKGRVAVLEILVVNQAVGNLIREAKTFQIPSIMQTSRKIGMQTIDQHLLELARAGTITPREAAIYADDKKLFADE